MEIAPMNKTIIVKFAITDLALKLWKLSKNMRKRLKWILEEMEVKLSKYDERALVLSKFVSLKAHRDIKVKELDEMQKGVANYSLGSLEQAERLLSLNNQVRCECFNFESKRPFRIDRLNYLSIHAYTFRKELNLSFTKIISLDLTSLLSEQIASFLSKVKLVDAIYFSDVTFDRIDLRPFNPVIITFSDVEFTESVYLPGKLEKLEIESSQGIKFVNCKEVLKLKLCDNRDTEEDQWNLILSVKGLKNLVFDSVLLNRLKSLPSTIRYLQLKGENIDLSGTKLNLPYLIQIKNQVSLDLAQKLRLRAVNLAVEGSKECFGFHPNKILVNDSNVAALNKHKELFEKVESVEVRAVSFNFDCLTENIRKLAVFGSISVESFILSRLERKCLEI